MLARCLRGATTTTTLSTRRLSFSTEAAVKAAVVYSGSDDDGGDITSSRSTNSGGGDITSTSNGGGMIKKSKGSSDGGDTIGRRLISLIYPKRSAVVTVNKWIEEGKIVRKYELNRAVRELRKLKRYKHALEICEWMRTQEDMKLLPGDYALHLDLVAKVRGLSSAEKFFEDLPEEMRGEPTCSALLHTYVQNKSTTKAEALMKKMLECGFSKNILPFNHMLSLYISNGQLDKVPEVIEELKKNTSPDVVTFNLWLTVCATKNNVKTAEKVHLRLKQEKIQPDWVTYSTLTNLYIKNDLHEKAVVTLKEMEKLVHRKNRVAFSSLITLSANLGDKDGVNRTWKKIKSTFRKSNDAEYMSMIASLLKLEEMEEAENIYKEWVSVSGTGDSRVSNLLLAAYINKNQMNKAETFLEEMVENGISPSYTTFELFTWGYLERNKNIDKVIDYFQKAIESVKKWEPNDKIVREIFSKLEMKGDIETAEKLLNILRSAGYVTTEIYNGLLRTYEKAGKMPLIVSERMRKDNVQLDEETKQLIKLTNKLCVGNIPKIL